MKWVSFGYFLWVNQLQNLKKMLKAREEKVAKLNLEISAIKQEIAKQEKETK